MNAVEWLTSLFNRYLAQPPLASDLELVTFGSPLDPVVGGSLEDAYCVLISWCTGPDPVGKCHLQVPYSCANGMYRRSYTYGRDVWRCPAALR